MFNLIFVMNSSCLSSKHSAAAAIFDVFVTMYTGLVESSFHSQTLVSQSFYSLIITAANSALTAELIH